MSGQWRKLGVQAGASVAAVAAAFAIGAVLMLLIGVNPGLVYARLFEGVVLNPYGVAQIFFKSTPLIFTGLAVALGFQAGLFNIGAEGQMLVGAFCAALAGFGLSMPAFLHVPVCLAAAFLGGMIWAAIPGALKIKTGAHEVITTIMMNFIAMALTSYFVVSRFHEPETVHTAAVAVTARLPRLEAFSSFFHGSPANATFFVALLACGVVSWLLWKMPLGYELRALGLSPAAAETAGIPVDRRALLAFAISGGLAGLAGTSFVLGYKHYFEDGFSAGAGFLGIAVALLGQNSPLGVVIAAFLFGGLSHGSLVINALVPKEIIEVLQALVIILVVVANQVSKRWAR
ncbi:MAG: ABC transporter permease [Elusimicrobia bacterium]|nr:ABC transporter permease [Elusimicrobiota bacterium]